MFSNAFSCVHCEMIVGWDQAMGRKCVNAICLGVNRAHRLTLQANDAIGVPLVHTAVRRPGIHPHSCLCPVLVLGRVLHPSQITPTTTQRGNRIQASRVRNREKAACVLFPGSFGKMLRWLLLLALALAVTTEAATPGYSKVIFPSVDCVQRHQPYPPVYFMTLD
jgi:hypothetical protein